ncbi:hypothetical protein SMACR_07703 [Sordaria macrospora]|uniref:WGS project CABT00000000 data, contig 2.27 n=2 Tax=Sordaria macrospora TaxID=5147 RepID=F7W4E7_SORMK|nr:uncharacterized protein SMAC_07703 [Sordaria macrospora k-hell]KAA8634890.1 hypothetical protein SMACR_07703 [Sordaria macrospora]KAH7635467.1 hypothetical protein B0T09DRAFT_317261 [Sordaria sp. MPI-SDFR-AT-0083]WPJ67399.1 hypothetical protein SMAC4_07703 [Sordaria macrospora]CCC14900.1 unnamed protein product [Sordaria macrospora k-hell]
MLNNFTSNSSSSGNGIGADDHHLTLDADMSGFAPPMDSGRNITLLGQKLSHRIGQVQENAREARHMAGNSSTEHETHPSPSSAGVHRSAGHVPEVSASAWCSQEFPPLKDYNGAYELHAVWASEGETDGQTTTSEGMASHTVVDQASEPIYKPAAPHVIGKPQAAPAADFQTSSSNTRSPRYTCVACQFSSNNRRDYERHLNTNKHRTIAIINSGHIDGVTAGPDPSVRKFRCPFTECRYHREGERMFCREESLWSHMRTVHRVQIMARVR